jgi:hypothetical protein
VSLRAWLRDLAQRGHPLTVGHERYARWRFSRDEADALAEMFRRERAPRTRSYSGRDLIVGFNGFVPASAPFDEFLAFLEALYDVYRFADVGDVPGMVRPPVPSLRRIKAGSPVELEWAFEAIRDSPATVAAVAIAIQQLAKALNEVLDGRARRKLVAAQAAATDRRSRAVANKLDAETKAISEESRARVSKIEAETSAVEAMHETALDVVSGRAVARPPLVVDDPGGLLADTSDARPPTTDARSAIEVMAVSVFEVDVVTVRWARRRRRR